MENFDLWQIDGNTLSQIMFTDNPIAVDPSEEVFASNYNALLWGTDFTKDLDSDQKRSRIEHTFEERYVDTRSMPLAGLGIDISIQCDTSGAQSEMLNMFDFSGFNDDSNQTVWDHNPGSIQHLSRRIGDMEGSEFSLPHHHDAYYTVADSQAQDFDLQHQNNNYMISVSELASEPNSQQSSTILPFPEPAFAVYQADNAVEQSLPILNQVPLDHRRDQPISRTNSLRKQRRKHTPLEWAEIQPIFKYHYIDEGRHLDDVVEILSREYNFIASRHIFKKRVAMWGLAKYRKASKEKIRPTGDSYSVVSMVKPTSKPSQLVKSENHGILTPPTSPISGSDSYTPHLPSNTEFPIDLT